MAYRDGWRKVDQKGKNWKKHWFRSGTSLCRQHGGLNGVGQEVPAVSPVGVKSDYCKRCVEVLHSIIAGGYTIKSGDDQCPTTATPGKPSSSTSASPSASACSSSPSPSP